MKTRDIHALLSYHDAGSLSAEQTINAFKIDSGYAERSAESKRLGKVIMKVGAGELPVTALTKRESVLAAAQDAQNAALGDSNDAEIEALRDALDAALGALGLDLPEAQEEDDEDELPVSVTDWEGITKPGQRAPVVQRFATVAEAEKFIDELHQKNPEKVERGDYSIDAPEEGA